MAFGRISGIFPQDAAFSLHENGHETTPANIFLVCEGNGSKSAAIAAIGDLFIRSPQFKIVGASGLSGAARTIAYLARRDEKGPLAGNALNGWRALGRAGSSLGLHDTVNEISRSFPNSVLDPVRFTRDCFWSVASAICHLPTVMGAHIQAAGHMLKAPANPAKLAEHYGTHLADKLASAEADYLPKPGDHAFPIYITVCDNETNEVRCLTGKQITHDAIRASCAFPGVFPAVAIDGRLYKDPVFTGENPPLTDPLKHFMSSFNGDFEIVIVRTGASDKPLAIPAGMQNRAHIINVSAGLHRHEAVLSSSSVEEAFEDGRRAAGIAIPKILAQRAQRLARDVTPCIIAPATRSVANGQSSPSQSRKLVLN